ncbi:hypothetical protein NST63_17860 [Heyndrickxia sp. FSL W8-0496]|uniref:hypothetical protein n=1 Tax=Heyndrickxia sp. FSL W8-0496 TaxID=2954702 RepID=UPI0030FCE96A
MNYTDYLTAQLIDILVDFQFEHKVNAGTMTVILMSLYISYMEQSKSELTDI